MKKISRGCVTIGTISLILSFIGVFFPLDGFKGYNLPFQILIISLQSGAIAASKLGGFIKVIHAPLFDSIFSIILVGSAIGTFCIKSWGRILGYIYAISIIFISAIGFPIILRGYIKEFTHMEKYGFLEGLVWGGALVNIFSLIGALLYPIILLIFFSQPKIKEKFSANKV